MSMTHQDTMIVGESPTDPSFVSQLAAVRRDAVDQVLLSQARCVDQLLDLYTMSAEPAVRAQLSSLLAEISRLSAVRAERVVETLDLCLAALDVESAFAHLLL